MWIPPKPISSSKGKWEVLKSNSFLSLEKQKAILSKTYRIILKRKSGHLIVASAENETQITNHWIYIESNMISSLSTEEEEYDDVIQYLELKFESLSKTEEDELHSFFRKTFGLQEENVLDYYACAYWKGVPKHGWMYITPNFVCFTSKMLSSNITIPFKEITGIRKEGSVNKGIQFTTNSAEYYFAPFMKRDITFDMVEQLWKGAVEKLLATAETTMGKLDMHSSLEYDSPRRLARVPSPSSNSRNLLKRRNSISDVTTEKKNEDFRMLFRFPAEENIISEFNCILGNDNNSGNSTATLKGVLYISQHFCGFHSKSEDTLLVVPFLDIKSITKEVVSPKDKMEALVLHLDDNVRFIFYFSQNCEEAFKLSLKLWNVVQAIRSKEESASLILYLNAKLDLPFCDEESQLQKQLWDRYLCKNKRVGFCVLKEVQSLKTLLKSGIPDHLRSLLWPICSGSLYKWVSQPGHYKELLEKYNNNTENSISMSDIDKDLHRSFPFHPFYQRKENLEILRRVLIAYSFRNSSIGYTQSMNVVAALLLIVMGEEGAFWLLATICEDLVPDHYGKLLLGPIVDQQMLEVHLKRELPDVYQHFDSIGFNLGVLTYGWFMCLFIGYLPIEGSLRVLDIFCLEGKKVLFQLSLAIFKIYKDAILNEKDTMKIIKQLKENMLDNNYKEILKVAFEDFDNIPMEDSSVLSYKFRAIKTLEDNNKSTQIYSLKNVTNFTSSELDDIHQKFHSLVSVDSTVAALDRSSFKQLLIQLVPPTFVQFLSKFPETPDLLWNKNLIQENELVEFSEFASFLSKITKGSVEQRLDFCFELFDEDRDNCVTKSETLKSIEGLISLYNKQENEIRIQCFVDMIFDQIQDMNEFSNEIYRVSTIGKMMGNTNITVSTSTLTNNSNINNENTINDNNSNNNINSNSNESQQAIPLQNQSSSNNHSSSTTTTITKSSSSSEIKIPFSILKKEMITNYKLLGMFRLESTPNSVVGRITRSRSNTVC